MVSFNTIPNPIKLPLVKIEVDGSQAGGAQAARYALIPGVKLASGSAVADTPVAVGSAGMADAYFGAGSQLARAYRFHAKKNQGVPIYCLPVVEPAGGTAASGSITVATAAAAGGTLSLYIAGQLVQVGLLGTETAAQTATKIAAAINAVGQLPVTAAVDGTVTTKVNLTAKWKGSDGNDITLTDTYRGTPGGEALPTGLSLTYSGSTLASGAGSPDYTNAIASLGDEPYEYVSLCQNDSTTLAAWAAEYGFSATGRWGYARQAYGVIFGAKRGTYSGLSSYGPTNNYPTISLLAIEAGLLNPIWEVAGQYSGVAATSYAADPARPLQTLTLDDILPAPRNARFAKTEANALAQVGLAIQVTAPGGVVTLMREQTTYQLNGYGQPDAAYELVTTLTTIAEVNRRLIAAISNKYGRMKLADDSTRFGPGQAVVTPNIIRAELVAEYEQMEYDGLTENTATFSKYLVVERDSQDTSRVNVLLPPDLVNGLRIFAMLNQFRLEYPAGA